MSLFDDHPYDPANPSGGAEAQWGWNGGSMNPQNPTNDPRLPGFTYGSTDGSGWNPNGPEWQNSSEGAGGLSGRNGQPGFQVGTPGGYQPSGGAEQTGGWNGPLRVGTPGAPQGYPGMPQGGASAGGPQGGGPPQVNRNDPQSVAAYVAYYAQQPGANPSLTRDPNYWIQKISSGELGNDPGYYVSKFMTPEGAPAGQGGQGGLNGPWGSTNFDFKYDPNSPDAQFLRGEAMRGAQQGAAARGTLNTGGTLKALQDRSFGLASTDLGNQFQRQYQTNALNFNQGLAANGQSFNQNFSLANLGLNATQAGINGANGVASNGNQFAGVGSSYGNSAAGNITGSGNAAAAGTVGSQNAYNQFYGNLSQLAYPTQQRY